MKNEIISSSFYILEPQKIQKKLEIIFENRVNLKDYLMNLPDNSPLIPLEQDDFSLFNPNTLTCPSIRFKRDYLILRHLYKQAPILIKKDNKSNEEIFNPYKIHFCFKCTFQLSSESDLFFTHEKLKEMDAEPVKKESIGHVWVDKKGSRYYPLYEGRMIWHYNHRLNSMGFAEKGKKRKTISVETATTQFKDMNFCSIPNYWVEEKKILERIPISYTRKWFFGFREVTGATNERSFISTIIPWTSIGNRIVLVLSEEDPEVLCCLLANFNSIIFDYIVRQKLSGMSLNVYILSQIPVITKEKYSEKIKGLIITRVLKLVYTSNDLKDFANDLNYNQKPFLWNDNEREQLQAELDAIFAILYKINKNDLKYILDTFKTLRRKELEKFNEFRTKRLILEAYDKFSKQKELFE